MTCLLAEVCFEADDPAALARFWAGALGRESAENPGGGITLPPNDDTAFRIRFLPAQEPKTGPDHWHLHLTSTSLEDQRRTVARLAGLGARHIDVGQRPEEGHVVLADPEGNLFCVIEPGNTYLAGCGFLAEITCDGSRDTGYFWSQALGWPLVWDRGLQTAIQSPEGGPKISWDAETISPRTGKSRMRFDLEPVVGSDQHQVASQHQEASWLASLGASRVGTAGDKASWVTMTDPDGHEFRVLARPGQSAL